MRYRDQLFENGLSLGKSEYRQMKYLHIMHEFTNRINKTEYKTIDSICQINIRLREINYVMRNDLKCAFDGKEATLVCLEPDCQVKLFCDGCSIDHSATHSGPTTIFSIRSLLQKNAVDSWFDKNQLGSTISQNDLWARHREFCLHMMGLVTKIDGFIKEKLKKESREFMLRDQAHLTKEAYQQFSNANSPDESKKLFTEYASEYQKLISLSKNPNIGSSVKVMHEIGQLYSSIKLQMDSIVQTVLQGNTSQESLNSTLLSLYFKDSTILLNPEHKKYVKERLVPEGASFKLLFRAKDNDFKASRFHHFCDDQGPTLTVIQVKDKIFGGFTDCSWASEGGLKMSSNSFLFSVDQKLKFSLRHPGKAVYHSKDCGPTFGGGHDLAISDNCGSTLSSWSSLGFSYVVPEELECDMPSLLAGSPDFYITDYEVYKVIYE